MIYLVTGSPGTGKTALVVDMILNNYEGLFKTTTDDGTEIDRPLYFCHIDGLDTRKLKAHELTEAQIQEKPLNEILPTGSVLIVDECDYTYPVRSAASKIPDYVMTLKELRHEGFTLILMTQHPTMIDKYIRNLIGKHIHLERKQIGTKRYEWFRCEETLNTTTFQNATWSWYTPPKKAFAYYKSATKHIKFNKKVHWVFYALPLIFIVLIYLLFNIGNNLNKRVTNDKDKNKSKENITAIQQNQNEQASEPNNNEFKLLSASEVFGDTTVKNSNPFGVETSSEPRAIGSKLEDYIPTVEYLPETKPIYDNLRQPLNMETVAGCVASKDSCNCYTEQATQVYVTESICREYVKNGIFQRYRNMNTHNQQISNNSSRLN